MEAKSLCSARLHRLGGLGNSADDSWGGVRCGCLGIVGLHALGLSNRGRSSVCEHHRGFDEFISHEQWAVLDRVADWRRDDLVVGQEPTRIQRF
jgi:hypothetical protein